MEQSIDLRTLNARQLDGLACCLCGGDKGPMQPITLVIGLQHFVHAPGQCIAQEPARESAA